MAYEVVWKSEGIVPAHWLVLEDGVPHLYKMRESATSPAELKIETVFDQPEGIAEFSRAKHARALGLDVPPQPLARRVWTNRGNVIEPMTEEEFRSAVWFMLNNAQLGVNEKNVADTTDETDVAAKVKTMGLFGFGGGAHMLIEAPSDLPTDRDFVYRAWRYEWDFIGVEVPYNSKVARSIGAPVLRGYRKSALAQAARQAEAEMKRETENRRRMAAMYAKEFNVPLPKWAE